MGKSWTIVHVVCLLLAAAIANATPTVASGYQITAVAIGIDPLKRGRGTKQTCPTLAFFFAQRVSAGRVRAFTSAPFHRNRHGTIFFRCTSSRGRSSEEAAFLAGFRKKAMPSRRPNRP